MVKTWTTGRSSSPRSMAVATGKLWCLLTPKFLVFLVWHPTAMVLGCWLWCQTILFIYLFFSPFFNVFLEKRVQKKMKIKIRAWVASQEALL